MTYMKDVECFSFFNLCMTYINIKTFNLFILLYSLTTNLFNYFPMYFIIIVPYNCITCESYDISSNTALFYK